LALPTQSSHLILFYKVSALATITVISGDEFFIDYLSLAGLSGHFDILLNDPGVTCL